MTPRNKRWPAVLEYMRQFCHQHDLYIKGVYTTRFDGRFATGVLIRSKTLYTREEADARSKEMNDELGRGLPHLDLLCKPLDRQGLKPWDKIYAAMEQAFEEVAKEDPEVVRALGCL
jgi:hypothetical protein